MTHTITINQDFRSMHPAKIEPSARIWYGVEVEGRWCAHSTAFVAEKLNQTELERLYQDVKDGQITQVFLTETFEEWGWLRASLVPFFCHTHKTILTCGRIAGPQVVEFLRDIRTQPAFEKIALFVRYLEAPWALELRGEDQLSIGVPYNLLNYRVDKAQHAKPDDYLKDVSQFPMRELDP